MPRVKKLSQKVTKKKVVKAKSELTIPVYGIDGKETGLLKLPKEIFKVDINPELLALYVRVYLANQRQGTASTKTRGEVTGSTRKIYKQKGTGRARHGDIKAPIFVGGGIVGGPKPRDYSLKLNKKQIKKALFSALSLKFKNQQISGLSNEFLSIKPKTKTIAQFLKSLSLDKKEALIVVPKMEKNGIVLASRNLPRVELLDVGSINPFAILKNKIVLIVEDALKMIKKNYASQ